MARKRSIIQEDWEDLLDYQEDVYRPRPLDRKDLETLRNLNLGGLDQPDRIRILREVFPNLNPFGWKMLLRASKYPGEDIETLRVMVKSQEALQSTLTKGQLRKIRACAEDLLQLGLREPWEFREFYHLYKVARNPKLSWCSPYQVKAEEVAKLVKTPGLLKLPEWVQIALVRSQNVPSGRIGNIWQLIPAAKGWMFSPDLPKGIAQKVGRMGIESRLLSYLAWGRGKLHESTEDRKVLINGFWKLFQELHNISLVDILMKFKGMAETDSHCRWVLSTLTDIRLGLEKGTAKRSLNYWWTELWWENLVDNLESLSEKAYFEMYGGDGKRLKQMLVKATAQQKLWAMRVARGNQDLIQKVLGMDPIIPYVDELVPFLRHLPQKVAIRLIGETTFKYRGQTKNISWELLKDCGFLWNKLVEKSIPKLGRLRDWFGIHEDLAKIYVERLPDGPLTVHPVAAQLNGVSAINGRWSLVVPKSVGELKWYGFSLANCVGGYGDRINSGQSMVLVVLEGGQPTHCIEIRKGRLAQFLGHRNSAPDPTVYEEVCEVLSVSGLAIG